MNLNHGSRTAEKPEGNGTLKRENDGNEILSQVLRLIKVLAESNNRWSIENPHSSFLFRQVGIVQLIENDDVHEAVFDQCEYGLTFPDCLRGERCKKRTRVIGNFPEIRTLNLDCSGTHAHVHALGGVSTEHGWKRRSKLAGSYPADLCKAWARALKQSLENEC